MKLDFLIKFRLTITIVSLPIILFITKKISIPKSFNNFSQFNEQSFFGLLNITIKRNKSMNNDLQIQDYNNTRIYFETNYNKIKLHVTLSKENYYAEKNIEFFISLKINNSSNITYINNSFYFSQKFDKYLNVKFTKTKGNIFNKKINYSLKNISIKFNNNYSLLESHLLFEDFNLTFNLNKEKHTYKYYYILESILTILYIFTIICINIQDRDHNLQNISIQFLLIMRSKIIISIIDRLIILCKIGIPFLKTLIFYFHLLAYSEFIFSWTDIIIIIIFFFELVCLGNYLQEYNDNEGNYFYCFNNKIENNKIIPNKNKEFDLKKFHINFFVIFSIVEICEISNSVFIKFIPLLLGIIITIYKHLSQREVTYLQDKKYCLNFYFYGTIIYSYYIFKYNIGEFGLIKNSISFFSLIPYFITIILYNLLSYIIKNEYRIKYAMKEDFKKLKKINGESCNICLEEFKYPKDKENNLFCKVDQRYNIHQTLCNHYYHERCMYKWRKYKNICPICRKALDTPKFYYFYDYNPCLYEWR